MGALARLRGPTRRAATRALGQTVTYTTGGDDFEIVAVFDAMSERETIGSEGLPVVTTAPTLWVDGATLDARPSAEPSAPDTVTVDGATYTVREVIADTIGGYLLILSDDREGLTA